MATVDRGDEVPSSPRPEQEQDLGPRGETAVVGLMMLPTLSQQSQMALPTRQREEESITSDMVLEPNSPQPNATTLDGHQIMAADRPDTPNRTAQLVAHRLKKRTKGRT
jgi:hypothetical protein